MTSNSLGAKTHSRPSPAGISDMSKLATFHESVIRPPILTHRDLSSFDILLRGDKVAGIIDWEIAGWLPLLGVFNGMACQCPESFLAETSEQIFWSHIKMS